MLIDLKYYYAVCHDHIFNMHMNHILFFLNKYLNKCANNY